MQVFCDSNQKAGSGRSHRSAALGGRSAGRLAAPDQGPRERNAVERLTGQRPELAALFVASAGRSFIGAAQPPGHRGLQLLVVVPVASMGLRDSGNSIGRCGRSLRRFRAVMTIAGFVAGDEDTAGLRPRSSRPWRSLDTSLLHMASAASPRRRSSSGVRSGASPPRLPLDGDDRRLVVVVGGRGRVMRSRNDSFCLTRCAWLRCPLPLWNGGGSKHQLPSFLPS